MRAWKLIWFLVPLAAIAEDAHDHTSSFPKCSSADSLPVHCRDVSHVLSLGGDMCWNGTRWDVTLIACPKESCRGINAEHCHSRLKDSPASAKTLAMAIRGLLTTFNEVGIVEYALEYVLQGAHGRLQAYLSQFVVGFLGSMTWQEAAVRQEAGIQIAPAGWGTGLKSKLQAQRKARWMRVKDARGMLNDGEPSASIAAYEQKLYLQELDSAICEGLLVAALHVAGSSGWTSALSRHLKLRTLHTDLSLNEKEDEYAHNTKDVTIKTAMRQTGYEPGNFGYGSTYLVSFLIVLQSAPLKERLRVLRDHPEEFDPNAAADADPKPDADASA